MTCEEGSKELQPCVCTRVCEEPPAPHCPGCEGCRGRGGEPCGAAMGRVLSQSLAQDPLPASLRRSLQSAPPAERGHAQPVLGGGRGLAAGPGPRSSTRSSPGPGRGPVVFSCAKCRAWPWPAQKPWLHSPAGTLLMGNASPRTGHPSPGEAVGPGEGHGAGTPAEGWALLRGRQGRDRGHREPSPRSCHSRTGQELEARTRSRQHPQGSTQPKARRRSQVCGELSREGRGRRGGRETRSPCEKDALNVLHPLGCTLDTAAS